MSSPAPISNLHGIQNVQLDQLQFLQQNRLEASPQLTGSLNTINTKLLNLNGNIQNTLTNQDDVLKILRTENSRLLGKKEEVDTAISSQNRMINLNDSYRKRYLDYMRIIILVVFVLVIVVGLRMFSKLVPAVPSLVSEILIVVVVFIGVVTCYSMYANISIHDRLLYDELSIKPLNVTPNPIPPVPTTRSPNGNGSGLGCVNEECCSAGTSWDSATGTCLPNVTTLPPAPPAAPPVMDPAAPPLQGFTTLTNAESEYSNYSKYSLR